MVAAVLVSIRYFLWRIGGTLNPDAPILSWLFLGIELTGFTAVVVFFVTIWRQPINRPVPAPAGRRVDVLISTENQPLGVIRDTVVCAVSVRYPHDTWILDFAARPEVEELAEELGCRYRAFEDDPTPVALFNRVASESEAEFLAVLEAEHVPTPDFVERMVGYFDDPKVAAVQANLAFYNLDSFQHSTDWEKLAAWHQQILFFNVIEPGKDAFDAAAFRGSPGMVRRAALLEIGGMATATLTEALHTGLRLQRAGHRVAYCSQPLARGLAPRTFDAFDTSWRRWGMGALQVLRHERPLTRPGLTPGQRLCYLTTFALPFAGLPKLGYLGVLVASALFGSLPLLASPASLVTYLLPYVALNLLAFASIHGGPRSLFFSQRYSVITLGALLRGVADHLRGLSQVRPSGVEQGAAASGRQVAPYLVMEAMLAAAVVLGMLRIADAEGLFEFWTFTAVVLVAAYGLFLLVPVVALAMRRGEARAAYRFPQRLDLPIRYRVQGADDAAWEEGFARNLNRFGLSVTRDEPFAVETPVEIVMPLPSREVRAQGTIRWTRELKGRNRHANGIRFEQIAVADQDAIARHLFWEVAPRHAYLVPVPSPAGRMIAAKA